MNFSLLQRVISDACKGDMKHQSNQNPYFWGLKGHLIRMFFLQIRFAYSQVLKTCEWCVFSQVMQPDGEGASKGEEQWGKWLIGNILKRYTFYLKVRLQRWKYQGCRLPPLRKNSHESLNLSLHANPSIHKYVSNFGLV